MLQPINQASREKFGAEVTRYVGVCHSEGPTPVPHRLVHTRACCMERLGWSSLGTRHSTWVSAANHPGHGGCCEAHGSPGIVHPLSSTQAEGRRHSLGLGVVGITHGTAGSLSAGTARDILRPSPFPL